LNAEMARVAEQQKRVFIRWAVTDWNQPAIAMYRTLGADFLDEWRTVVLGGDGLKKLRKHMPITVL
jgi:hypothetical protein